LAHSTQTKEEAMVEDTTMEAVTEEVVMAEAVAE
jgi:hypothetical protein